MKVESRTLSPALPLEGEEGGGQLTTLNSQL